MGEATNIWGATTLSGSKSLRLETSTAPSPHIQRPPCATTAGKLPKLRRSLGSLDGWKEVPVKTHGENEGFLDIDRHIAYIIFVKKIIHINCITNTIMQNTRHIYFKITRLGCISCICHLPLPIQTTQLWPLAGVQCKKIFWSWVTPATEKRSDY